MQTWLGYIGFLLALIGTILNAQGKKSCWWVWMVSNLVWFVYAAMPTQPAILLEQVMFLAMNIYGLRKWSKKV